MRNIFGILLLFVFHVGESFQGDDIFDFGSEQILGGNMQFSDFVIEDLKENIEGFFILYCNDYIGKKFMPQCFQ